MKQLLTEEQGEKLVALQSTVQAALAAGNETRVFAVRRNLRNRIFRIRQGLQEDELGLIPVLKRQFDGDMSLETFTFNWDLGPRDPFRVVHTHDWRAAGGDYEEVMVPDPKTGVVKRSRICRPTAFTEQR